MRVKELASRRLRIGQTPRLLLLASIAWANCLANRVFIPHSWRWIVTRSTWLGRHGLNGIKYNAAIDRRCHFIRCIWLPKTLLKVSKDTFISILWDKTTIIGYDVRVATSSIPKVTKRWSTLVRIYFLVLVGLVDVEGGVIIDSIWLIASPGRCLWHISITN